MSASVVREAGSFRDRKSRVFYAGDTVLRGLNDAARDNWKLLSSSSFYQTAQESGKLVKTAVHESPVETGALHTQQWQLLLAHERIPFVSYPYEWPFGMLKDAALLQLELLLDALAEEMILQDSSAYNIQWMGARPVFIDIPSFVRHPAAEPWVGYRQFCELFLFPLLLQAYKGVPFHAWLRGSVDGISAQDCWGVMSLWDLLRPGVLAHVYLHSKLQARYGDSDRDVKAELESAGFKRELVLANVKRLLRLVRKLRPRGGASEWADYAENTSYTDQDTAAKERFVQQASSQRRWGLVWDLGGNTGRYSCIAAQSADYVVSMDADHEAVERMYQRLKAEGVGNVLPLVMNLADISPSLGWRAEERRALTARDRPDFILCLALIHHMVITANIPLEEFLGWLADLGAALVIEFPSKDDPMVEKLLRNKEDTYNDYTPQVFETCLGRLFNVERRVALQSGTRTLYFATPK